MSIKTKTQEVLGLAAKGIEIIDEGVSALINDHGLSEGIARAKAKQAELEAQQAADIQAKRTAIESVTTYLAQPRRAAETITADIEAARNEQATLASELAQLEADTITSEPSPKAAARYAQIQLTLKGFSGRLQRLEAELTDARQAEIVADYQATVNAVSAMGKELTEFEGSAEWQETLRAYQSGIEKINRWRLKLKVEPISRRDTTEAKYGVDAVRAVGSQLDAIDGQPDPYLHMIWR